MIRKTFIRNQSHTKPGKPQTAYNDLFAGVGLSLDCGAEIEEEDCGEKLKYSKSKNVNP